jgi:hypothetical protein
VDKYYGISELEVMISLLSAKNGWLISNTFVRLDDGVLLSQICLYYFEPELMMDGDGVNGGSGDL